MNSFISLAKPFEELLKTIVSSNNTHAKWLNTLSYLENCGARKIAACEHPTKVKEEMLKHAAEEFRHAHHLKKQIGKISSDVIEDYSLPCLLGGISTMQYLNLLDLKTSRYLKERSLSKTDVREAAYLLCTYAIELRAEELYPIYDEALRKTGSKVAVKSILVEEKEHLRDMREELKKIPSGFMYAEQICLLEGNLCKKWVSTVSNEVKKSGR